MGLAALVAANPPTDNRQAVAFESMSLLEQIDALLAEPASRDADPSELARLERTLTDGYAHALSLEAEQLRLQRRMTELAGELHEGNQEQKAEELIQVSHRMSGARAELERLRSTLKQLRLRVRTARR
jgi:ABC-type phosphate transport system auxiliary subunit